MTRLAELNAKHERVCEYLQRHDLEAVLLAMRHNFSWYTSGAHNYVSNASTVGNSYLLIDAAGATVICNNIEETRLAAEDVFEPLGLESFFYADPADQASLLNRLIGSRRIATDAPIGGVDAPRLGKDFDALRFQLLPGEIERMSRLASDTVSAMEATCRTIEPGQTEGELAGQFAARLYAIGAIPWVLLVGADDRIVNHRHPLPTSAPCNKYAMFAIGAERDGLLTACSRLVSFRPLSQELIDKHHAVATVDAALWSKTVPGVSYGEIFAEAQDAYAATGFADQWRFHHQGGSIGYQPREAKAAPNDPTLTLVDQAFAWNPSITGTKSEDTILCRPGQPLKLAGETDWPMISVEWKGLALQRPAILVR
jgi:Xaa-Pro aminopeptidase